ncbi:adenosylmethionine-8-amino-7-oxononanoate aminotransferase [Verticillium dahliae VdLs.17]|uniref:Adenosylmethionine-8-amino-7-oxononanoate aminotransferase n=1 Tax=Verticillium dahliae (strain VdLs.17 / ATCC MYA-4575 / FGSC 10137) TaxID=498257 RepID=G2XGS2_VERDV|nr:adenosylmethionine-8-amino-7-oxononanoate aminotransferase [Verticillium dahliae VdLs.17]EGY19020.1 adenosylmethionine-8-amino-7-oxononanoate aminotransferase [Verticillium dahliae VdLs.17]
MELSNILTRSRSPIDASSFGLQVYGANTDVGKTIFTTILCNAATKFYNHERTSYLKPVSTGPASEADKVPSISQVRRAGSPQPDHARRHIERFAPSVAAETLVQYNDIPSDDALRRSIHDHALKTAALGPGWLFLETAGGVHSPGPTGTPQADLYAPLRLPTVLVGDSKLGGISQTIAAYESLKLRGLDVEAVLLFQNATYENHLYLKDYFQEHAGIPVETVTAPPERHEDPRYDHGALLAYYERESSSETAHGVLKDLDHRGKSRIARLENMPQSASKNIWYPFTQQKLLTPDRISVIDSANGDFFQVLTPAAAPSPANESGLLQPAFDGSASWWTQGLGHGNPRLTLAAAYAAGRYGHVMFAEAIHEPALALAEKLLHGMGNPRLTRVFYTDNGSTGCEVAVKMALRAARLRYGWAASEKMEILGLKGSYHGDTIGTMDCSEPSVFNEKVEWYQGKGFWFDYPSVWCRDGKWVVDTPEALQNNLGDGAKFGSLSDVFDLSNRTQTKAYESYKNYFRSVLERLQKQDGRKFGALMLEPVVLGAGGMILVDPLYQKALVDVVRSSPELFGNATASSTTEHDWQGLPVIFDEVFTGLYRLGRFSSSSLLATLADISVHAKLLTGGLLPLSTTLASESIFDAFASDDKSDALLHGHSYTAHAVGCQVAVESLDQLQRMDENGAWDWAKKNSSGKALGAAPSPGASGNTWSMWSNEFIDSLSRQSDKVAGAWALGSVLTISMRSDDGVGYTSKAAARLQAGLRDGKGAWDVHTRVLGNVLYIMTGQTTQEGAVREMEGLVQRALESLRGS